MRDFEEWLNRAEKLKADRNQFIEELDAQLDMLIDTPKGPPTGQDLILSRLPAATIHKMEQAIAQNPEIPPEYWWKVLNEFKTCDSKYRSA